MKFKDRLVRCGACGAEFVYTVPEQRRRAAQGQAVDAPAFCKECRGADVRLAEAAEVAETEVIEAAGDTPVVETTTTSEKPKGGKRPPKQKKGGPSAAKSRGKSRGSGGKSRGRGRRRGGSSQRDRPRQTEIRVRHFGTVKWFDESRGFGFIAEDNGDELFVHSSGVLTGGQPALEQGQSVEYEVEHTDRGLQAVDVVPIP